MQKKKVDYEFFCRALRTMIDLGRITEKCTDCPQIMPIAGDLTMNGANRHIYRLGYKGAQSFGVKVSLGFHFLKKLLFYSIDRYLTVLVTMIHIPLLTTKCLLIVFPIYAKIKAYETKDGLV